MTSVLSLALIKEFTFREKSIIWFFLLKMSYQNQKCKIQKKLLTLNSFNLKICESIKFGLCLVFSTTATKIYLSIHLLLPITCTATVVIHISIYQSIIIYIYIYTHTHTYDSFSVCVYVCVCVCVYNNIHIYIDR